MKRAVVATVSAMCQIACVAQDKAPILVSISTPMAAVPTGTDIIIVVNVTNVSNHSIKIIKALGPDGQAEAANLVEVRDSHGEKLIGRPLQKWLSRKKISVEPGGSVEDTLDLSKLYEAVKPGRYTVWVRHELQPDSLHPEMKKSYITSNSLVITVM